MDVLLIVGIAFVAIGIIMLVVGNKLKKSLAVFMESAVPTQAEIVEIQRERVDDETMHRTLVKYTYNTIPYGPVNLGYYKSGFHVGDVLDAYINPLDPEDIRSQEGDKFGYRIVNLLGGIFLVLGIIVLVIAGFVLFK